MSTKMHTIRKKMGSLKIKVTQYLLEEYSFGHYFWVIEDSRGNVKGCGWSGGSPPNKLRESDAMELFRQWEEDHGKKN